MNATASSPLLQSVSRLVEQRLGLVFPPKRWDDLARGLRAAAAIFGHTDVEDFARWLISTPLNTQQIETLSACLTIGETYFLRGQATFAALRQTVLPEIIERQRAANRKLRLWSAACATGEEPYSLAILLTQLLPDLADWQITILGTDINPLFLKRAHAGRYRQWSFRDVPLGFKERYFQPVEDGTLELLPHIRRMVTLAQLNLAEDVYPALLNNTTAVDLILCRNVLMYFSSAQQQRVVHNLYRCAVDGGWLVVAPTEASTDLFPQFAPVDMPGIVFYRKDTRGHTPAQTASGPHWDAPLDAEPLPVTADLRPAAESLLSMSAAPSPAHPSPAALGDTPGLTLPPSAPAAEIENETLPPANTRMEASRLYELGHYQQAVDTLLSVDSQALDAESCLLAARACANQGQLEAALSWCRRTTASDRLNPVGHYLQANILMELGSVTEASDDLRRAIYLDPDFVMAHYTLGTLFLLAGKQAQAARYLDNARQLAAGCPADEVLPHSEGLTARRLIQIINTMSGGDHD